MSYLKNIQSVFSSIKNMFSDIQNKEEKKYDLSEGDIIDEKDHSSTICYLTKKYIDSELAIDKNKKNNDVFSQHRDAIIRCLKRYEEHSLNYIENLQKKQATEILEALQQGNEIPVHDGFDDTIDADGYINKLRKITLTYCQNLVLTMDDFLCNIPGDLCDGKNASTELQSFRDKASKKRWSNFKEACEGSFVFLHGRVFFDTTLWGSGKNGFMLERDSIICLGGEPEKFFVFWKDVTSLWHSKGYLHVNNYKTGFVANDKARQILDLLEEHYDKVKSSEGNLLLTYLDYDSSRSKNIQDSCDEDMKQFLE